MGIVWDTTASLFRALGYPTRLQVLAELREPKVLQELNIQPGPTSGPGNPDRTLTRQGIRHHLNQLTEAGLVRVEPTTRNEHVANLYQARPEQLFNAAQILHELASTGRPLPDPGADGRYRPTWAQPQATDVTGPRLVLVYGIEPGRTFKLDDTDRPADRGWIVGRLPDVQIPLSHDPFAADKHAEVLPNNGGFEILDLRASDRPTYVDWAPLDLGGSAYLKPGTIVGIGRSLLVFRDD